MGQDSILDMRLTGTGVSPGVAKGRVYLLDRGKVEVHEYHIAASQVEDEIRRFHRALTESKRQLEEVQARVKNAIGQEHLYILEPYFMIIEDRMLIEGVEESIRKERINAEYAVKKVLQSFSIIFDRAEDEYLRERRSDILHAGDRILRNLMGHQPETLTDIAKKAIIVAHDLAPSDTVQMTKGNILAFVTDIGGPTSHTAIMARSLGIPAVIGLKEITGLAHTGDTLIVDGTTGTVSINPSAETQREYFLKRRRFRFWERGLLKYRNLDAQTRDGYRIRLSANVELLEEIPTLKEFGGQGIGLYRTEFLYLNRHDLPSEDEHLQMYRRVVEGVRPLPAIIRTVDLGGDKFVSKLTLAEEMNPAMGLRAIRFCLKVPEIFKVQLRALLRASAYGQVKIMFPMISGIEEIREAKQVVTEVKEDLDRAGITYDRDIQIGIMVEIPSAALMADLLAREVDFFSIGTNDLIQYFMAIDRVNEQVAYLYEPLHPAVIRIIVSVIEGAHRAGIPVAMCGEMAGDPLYTLVLLGLGLDELSMAPHSIPVIKKVIRESSFAEGKEILGEILKLATAKEIEEYVRTKMALRFPAGFPKSFTSNPARGWC